MKGEKEFHKRIHSYLDSIGATNIAWIDGKRHGRFVFNYQGRDFFVHCSSSPGCSYAHHNAIGDIRRMLRKVDNDQRV